MTTDTTWDPQEQIREAAKRIDVKIGRKKELKTAHELLQENEPVEVMVDGMYRDKAGLLIVTDRRAIFYRAGMMSSFSEDINYSKMTSVSYQKKMTKGVIRVMASGHSVEFDVYNKKAAQMVAERLRAKID